MRAGDREASPPERGNGFMPWRGPSTLLRPGLQTVFLERTPGKKASEDPSTKDGIETIRLRASLFRSHLSIDTVSSVFL
jgi:hypothetical protein